MNVDYKLFSSLLFLEKLITFKLIKKRNVSNNFYTTFLQRSKKKTDCSKFELSLKLKRNGGKM